MTRRRIGIDVGGTKAQGVALDSSDAVVATARRDTPRGEGSIPALIDTLVELVAELGPADAIGVGVPGLVSRDGVLHAAPNLDGVSGFEVGRLLSERIGHEVAVDNDATCAAIAERALGAARGRDDVVVVTLGTGIGGGLITAGQVYRGRHGFAGEIGHMVVDPDGPPCPCGRRGCWERYASGAGLAMLAGGISGEEVLGAARAGDRPALAVVDEFARWVALGLANLTNVLDPELFVLGGGLADGADVYLDPIVRWFGELIYQPDRRPHPEIAFATTGPLAGAIGAALL